MVRVVVRDGFRGKEIENNVASSCKSGVYIVASKHCVCKCTKKWFSEIQRTNLHPAQVYKAVLRQTGIGEFEIVNRLPSAKDRRQQPIKIMISSITYPSEENDKNGSPSFTTRMFNLGMEDTQLCLINQTLAIYLIYLIYQPPARNDFETVTFTIMGNYFYPRGDEYECSFSEIESKYVFFEHHQGLL